MFTSNVVVTGLGMASPIGCDIQPAMSRLANGESGISANHNTQLSAFVAKVAEYQPTRHATKISLRRTETLNHLSVNAAGDALAMAGLKDESNEDTGVILGTGYAGIESVIKHQKSLIDEGNQMLRPVYFPTTVYNASAGMIAIEYQLKGANSTITGLDLPAEYALLYACLTLQKQPDTKIVVVGADAHYDHLQFGLSKLRLLSSKDSNHPEPAFSQANDGIIMGEGAGALVLETEKSAQARGANILAHISGIYQENAHEHPYNYANTNDSAMAVIRQLIARSDIALDKYGLLSVSANGAPALNKLEGLLVEQLDQPNLPTRALSDYIGAFPGSGILRILLTICAFKDRINISSFTNENTFHTMKKPLTAPIINHESFIHLANGLGGNSIAVDIRVPH